MNRRGPARVGRVARSGPRGWGAPTPLVYFFLVAGASNPFFRWSEQDGRAVGRPVVAAALRMATRRGPSCSASRGTPDGPAWPRCLCLPPAVGAAGQADARWTRPRGSPHPRRVAHGGCACRCRTHGRRALVLFCHRRRDGWAGATEPGGTAQPTRRQRVFGRPRHGHRAQRPQSWDEMGGHPEGGTTDVNRQSHAASLALPHTHTHKKWKKGGQTRATTPHKR